MRLARTPSRTACGSSTTGRRGPRYTGNVIGFLPADELTITEEVAMDCCGRAFTRRHWMWSTLN